MIKARSILSNNRKLIENFSYVTLLQVFIIVAPLITYPYLVRVLGRSLYGVVLTAQMLASYASLIINFGSNEVCAKHVSINRDNTDSLSEIVSSVISVRSLLFFLCFVIYLSVVFIVPSYKTYWLLFLLSYTLTINDVLFPQFFFQGMEQMKYITIISIATKVLFIGLVFFIVKTPDDYLWVPILYAIGYIIGALFSLYIILHRFGVHLYVPSFKRAMIYVKDSSAIFATDLVCTIKDKVNYLLVGSFSGMGNVVIYDLGLKLNSFISKPLNIITTVMLPRFAKDRNVKTFKKVVAISFGIALSLVALVNIFLPAILDLFLGERIDMIPLRLFLLAPLFLSVSVVIYNNMFVAFGYNKYAFYSIIITTAIYIISLLIFWIIGALDNVYSFIIISLVSYFSELVYRIIKARSIVSSISETSNDKKSK